MADKPDATTPPATPAAGTEAKISMMQKIKNNFTGEAWEKGKGKIALRGAGALVSLGVMYDGAKRVLRGAGVASPKLDEEGKEMPAGGGAVVGGLVEMTAAAAGLWASLVYAGKGRGVANTP
jgi:hypothetical protein